MRILLEPVSELDCVLLNFRKFNEIQQCDKILLNNLRFIWHYHISTTCSTHNLAMSTTLAERVHFSISNREDSALLRRLRKPRPTDCDFSSNDYLGLTKSTDYQQFVERHLQTCRPTSTGVGSTGSRLLTGHSDDISEVERLATEFHNMPEALLFNSGYDANLSLLSCLPGPNDFIIYDELVHASVHDGMRMSRARKQLYPFKHNDVTSLEQKIRHAVQVSKCQHSVIVCIESVYSMDGDIAPIVQILDACEDLQNQLGRDIHLIVDEAHAGGIYGSHGQGMVSACGVNKHPNLLAVLVTFGKAFGAHGAVVLCQSVEIKTYLINYSRPLIYSTALPPHSICVLRGAYRYMSEGRADEARARLKDLINFFQDLTAATLPTDMLLYNARRDVPRRRHHSPIQAIVVRGNDRCVRMTTVLRKKGFDVYPIRSPTVPKGSERIRIVLHANNTKAEIQRLVNAILRTIATDDLTPRSRL